MMQVVIATEQVGPEVRCTAQAQPLHTCGSGGEGDEGDAGGLARVAEAKQRERRRRRREAREAHDKAKAHLPPQLASLFRPLEQTRL